LWSSTRSLTNEALLVLLVGLVVLGAFLWVEYRRGVFAMMPLSLFEGRCFSGLNLLTFLLYAAFAAAMLLIPYVLITSGGYSPVQAGLAMLPLPIVMTTVSPKMGSLAAKMGPRIPLTIGPMVVAAGMLLSMLADAGTSYWTGIFPMIVVMAIGMTIAVAPLTASVLGSVEERHVAMASGFNSAVARTGGLIATALLGAVLASKGADLFSGFHSAMIVSAGVSALASIVALTMLGGIKMKNAA